MSNLVIRNYQPKDLPNIVKLYNSSQVGSPFFIRDNGYFNHFTSYPGVRGDSIFVAASEHEIKGLVIIAIIQRNYTIGRIPII